MMLKNKKKITLTLDEIIVIKRNITNHCNYKELNILSNEIK